MIGLAAGLLLGGTAMADVGASAGAWQQVLAGPAERCQQSAVVYAILHRATGDTLAGGTLFAVEVKAERGGFRWERDTLHVLPQTVGSFTLDQTSRRVDPAGFLYVEVENGAVVQSVASGAYAGLAPAIGESLPLALPLSEGVAFDFDLAGYQRRDIDIHIYAEGDTASRGQAAGEGLIIRPHPFGESVFVSWPPSSPARPDSAAPTISSRR